MVLAATTLVVLISFIFNLFKFEDFTDYTGPVKVTFGSPDSIEEDTLSTELPVEETITEPEPVVEDIEPVIDEVVPVEEVIPEEITEPIETPIPEPKPPVVEKPEPVKPVIPLKPVVQKGRESGNSHETSFESSSSKIGRRAYFPIYQFMPLPENISMDVYALINGDITGFDEKDYNKNFFERFYWKNGNEFEITDSVPYQNRPYLWGILESAGYDIEAADYKNKYNLKTIVIVFEIHGNATGSNAIKSAVVENSSGNDEIDEAVLYGFKQSTYSNSTSESVKGRFKYSFDNP